MARGKDRSIRSRPPKPSQRPARGLAARVPATLLAVAALLIAGGTAAPARAASGDMPEAIAEQAVDVARSIAAQASVGDEAANGLAAPTGGTLGIPSPSPSGQEGAAPADGQVGAAPGSEEPSSDAPPVPAHPAPSPPGAGTVQQDAPVAPDLGAPASSGDAGTAEPVHPAPAGALETTPISTPSEPSLVADEPPTRIYEPGSGPRPMRRVRPQAHPAPRHAPAGPAMPAPQPENVAAVQLARQPYAAAVADVRKTPPQSRLRHPPAGGAQRDVNAPAQHRDFPPNASAATATSGAGGSTTSPTAATVPGVAALAANGPLSRFLVSVPSWRLLSVTEPPERPG